MSNRRRFYSRGADARITLLRCLLCCELFFLGGVALLGAVDHHTDLILCEDDWGICVLADMPSHGAINPQSRSRQAPIRHGEGGNEEMRFSCPSCRRKFSTKGNLGEHLRSSRLSLRPIPWILLV